MAGELETQKGRAGQVNRVTGPALISETTVPWVMDLEDVFHRVFDGLIRYLCAVELR